jgi:phosphomannomutase
MGEEYTSENVARITRATHLALMNHPKAGRGIAIGYDTRRNSDVFAKQAAEILASLGWKVYLSQGVSPTPAVSLRVRDLGCAAGIVITASHNPPEFNGYKLKGEYGGPAPADLLKTVEAALDQRCTEKGGGRIVVEDFVGPYLKYVGTFVDLEAIRSSGLRIGHHAMHGAGGNLVEKLLAPLRVQTFAGSPDSQFGGIAPEPTAANTGDFRKKVPSLALDLILVTDGDSDRIGLIDSAGEFVDAQFIFSLTLEYLAKERGLSGKVCKTNAVSERVDRICVKLGLPLETLPIGFKHVAARMEREKVLMGGEEAGGLGIQQYLPERDGIMMGLLIAELMAKEKKSLRQLIAALQNRYGELHYERWDLKLTPAARDTFVSRWKAPGPAHIAGHRVVGHDTLDGLKMRFEGGGWLLVRVSGTEPVVRLYCEMTTLEGARAVLAEAAGEFRP